MSTDSITMKDFRDLVEKSCYLNEVTNDYILNKYRPLSDLGLTKYDLEKLAKIQNKIIVSLEQAFRYYIKNRKDNKF